MISYIVPRTLGNVVNVEFNSPLRLETRKGARQGVWIPISRVVWEHNNKSVCSKGNVEPFSFKTFFSLFQFVRGIFNFLSCRFGVDLRVGVY